MRNESIDTQKQAVAVVPVRWECTECVYTSENPQYAEMHVAHSGHAGLYGIYPDGSKKRVQ